MSQCKKFHKFSLEGGGRDEQCQPKSATLCRVREMQARVRFAGCARNPLRRAAPEWEENWRLGSATFVRGAAGEWVWENW